VHGVVPPQNIFIFIFMQKRERLKTDDANSCPFSLLGSFTTDSTKTAIFQKNIYNNNFDWF